VLPPPFTTKYDEKERELKKKMKEKEHRKPLQNGYGVVGNAGDHGGVGGFEIRDLIGKVYFLFIFLFLFFLFKFYWLSLAG